MTCIYPELGSASDWILIDITNQKHYPDLDSDAYEVSALISQTSFCGDTSGGVAKCVLFTQTNKFEKSWCLVLPQELFPTPPVHQAQINHTHASHLWQKCL